MELNKQELELLKALLHQHSQIEQEYKSLWVHKMEVTDPLFRKVCNELEKVKE